MRRRDGIALVVSLVVLVVLVAIGLGSMFLAQMNLGIAQNTRASALAENAAESGLDSFMVYLSSAYTNDGAFPADKSALDAQVANLSLPGVTFEVASYERYADDQARIAVRGLFPGRNAEHVSEALVIGLSTPTTITPTQDPLFGKGLVTDGSIYLPGNANLDIDMWAGQDINVTGGKSKMVGGHVAQAGGTDCSVGHITCTTNATPPSVPKPVFDDLRAKVMADNATDCSATSTFPTSGTVICLPPNASVTLGDIHDAVVIGDASTTVTVQGDAANLTLVSGTVDLGSTSTLSGTTTVIAKNDIDFAKNVTSVDNVAHTFIISEGAITIKGNGGRDIYASFWAGGAFEINGKVGTMVTTVVASSTAIGIRSNGVDELITTPDAVDNPYIPPDPGSTTVTYNGLRVVSRR